MSIDEGLNHVYSRSWEMPVFLMDTSNAGTLENRLTEIKEAFDKGLLDKTEYEEKRKEIIGKY